MDPIESTGQLRRTHSLNLRRSVERITIEELAEQARGQQIASIEDVRWAVFEPSGQISFIPKQ